MIDIWSMFPTSARLFYYPTSARLSYYPTSARLFYSVLSHLGKTVLQCIIPPRRDCCIVVLSHLGETVVLLYYPTSARLLFAAPLPRPVRQAREMRRPSTKKVRMSPFPFTVMTPRSLTA